MLKRCNILNEFNFLSSSLSNDLAILMFRRFKKTKSFFAYFTVFRCLLTWVVMRFWITSAWSRTKLRMFCMMSMIFFALTIKSFFFVVTYEIEFDEKLMRKWNSLLTKNDDNSIVAEIALLFANSIIDNQTFQLSCM